MIGLAITLSALMIGAAVALTGWRMLRGPSIADRAVGMDLLGLLAVAAAALLALSSGHLALLDIALGLGLVGFVGAVGVAAFIERAAAREEAPAMAAAHGRMAEAPDPLLHPDHPPALPGGAPELLVLHPARDERGARRALRRQAAAVLLA